MKFSLNKISSFLKGLMKSKSDDKLMLNHGYPFHGVVTKRDDTLVLCFMFHDTDRYDEMVGLIDSTKWKTPFTIQRRLLDLSEPVSLKSLKQIDNFNDLFFIISGIDLYPPDPYDNRGMIDLVIRKHDQSITEGMKISIVPITDTDGRLRSLEFVDIEVEAERPTLETVSDDKNMFAKCPSLNADHMFLERTWLTQIFSYGEPLLFDISEGDSGEKILSHELDHDAYLKFKEQMKDSILEDLVGDDGYPIVNMRRIDTTVGQTAEHLISDSVEYGHFVLDYAELNSWKKGDHNLTFYVNDPIPLLEREEILLTPVLDRNNKFVCFDFTGVDNTDLNNLLQEAIEAGKEQSRASIAAAETMDVLISIKDGNDNTPSFGSPEFIAESTEPVVKITVGKALCFNPTFKNQQETLTAILDEEDYKVFLGYFLYSRFSKNAKNTAQCVRRYNAKTGDVHPLREFTEGSRLGLIYTIDDICIEELSYTKEGRITLGINRFVWPNVAPSHLGWMYNLTPVLDESGKLLAFIQQSRTEAEHDLGHFNFIPELRLPVTRKDTPDDLAPKPFSEHLTFGSYTAIPDGIENTKEYKQDLDEVMAKDMEYIRDHILNTLGIPKECILPQGDDLLEIYSRPFWQKYLGDIQGNVMLRLDECRNNIDTIMLPVMVEQGLTVTAQTIAPENLKEVKMLVDIATMSDEKYKELEALRIEKYGE